MGNHPGNIAQRKRLVMLLAFLLISVGCLPGPPSLLNVPCLTVEECGDELRCINHRCRPKSEYCEGGCPSGQYCDKGTCILECLEPDQACGAICADLQSNRNHCGACDNKCKPTESCTQGTCELACQTGQTVCGETCVDTQTNPNHCGACDTKCASGEVCSQGRCQTACQTGLTPCNDTCIDTNNSTLHCGACDNTCQPGERCVNGTCRLSCQTGLSVCANTCIDTQTNNKHCGTCDNACPPGQVCSQGTCGLTCQTGLTNCKGTCIDTQKDHSHCGTCDNTCQPGEVCNAGTCQLNCPQGLNKCGTICTSLTTDNANCGTCGTICKSGEACINGSCTLPCTGNQTKCTDGCANLQTDNGNCGACGTICTGGTSCNTGRCICPPGQTACSGTCVDTKTNRQHCGACGTTCNPGELCSTGSCVITCPATQIQCAGMCIDTKADNNHCGTCGTKCTGGKTCTNGTCACPSGQTDCNGVCVNTQTNRNHCGGCSTTGTPKACQQGEFCVAGNCVVSCPSPQTPCAGTCVDTQTNTNHCGTCGNACTGGKTCQNGSCQCTASTTDCGGNCVDTKTDRQHCGACQQVCASNAACFGGLCQASCPGAQLLCGGLCIDPQTNPNHCGTCGNTCTGGRQCAAGTCGCPAGTPTNCNGTCTNTNNDPNHCGTCGTVCQNGQLCVSGICRAICQTGQTNCNNTCVNLSTNQQNCGTCGLSCNPLESCQNGFCLPSLPPFPLVTTGSQLERITRDQQGNIYVIGHFSGSDSLDTISLTSAGSTDILVAKFDRTGTLQWAEQAGGPAQDEGYGIAVSHTGHIFITGRFKGTASFGSTLLTSGSDFDLFVGKLDANGNWLWAKAAGGASSLIDTANAVGVDTNGNAIITGSISQTAIFGSTTLTGTGTRMFVAQIDANGNWKWAISSSHTTGTSQGNQIAVTSGGGSFIAGQFDGTATFGSSTLTSAGNTDAFVAQLDANGAFQWVRQGSSTANVIARDITRQPNGSIAITGTFEGNAVLGGTTLTHLGNKDLFVALLQPNGALQWARAAGGSGAEDSPSITTDTDGYIYVSGQFTGNAIFGLSLPNTLTAQGSSDIFVAKWDSTGTFLTVKQAGGSGIDTAKSMTTDAFGNVIAAGTFGGTANFDGTSRTATGSSDLYLWRTTLVTPAGTKASGTSQEFASGIAVSPDGEACVIGLLQGTVSFGTSSIISNGRDDGWVAKVDSNGAFKWVRRIGGNTLNDRALGVTTDLQGNCYITGYFQDIAAFGSTTLTSTSGQSDVFVAKLDKAGIYQWATQATGNGFKQGKQIALGPNGNLYITGSFLNTATFGTTTLTAAGSFDAFVASLSANGSFQWAKRAGGVADDRGRGIAVDASGDVVICGWFNGTGTFGTITTNATSNDLFVAKLSSTGTFQWVSKSTLSGATLSHQLTTDSNDDIYIAGYFTGTSAWGSTTLTSAGGNDGFLTKLSNTGTFQWTKAMTSTGNVETTGTNIDANSNIVVSGFFNGTMTIGGTTETSTNTDAFIGRFDTNGNLQWTLFSKGAGGETLHGVGTDFFGRLFGVGSFSGTTTVGPHSLTASGSDDILVWLTQP